MFIDENVSPQGEQRVTDQPMKLSEAIRKGKPLIGVESRLLFRLCALGCAWAGVRGSAMTPEEYLALSGRSVDAIADTLGFERALCAEVSNLHYDGTPALEIAAILESRGQ